MSLRQRAEARTRTRTSPGPGSGSGRSTTSTWPPPGSSTAFIGNSRILSRSLHGPEGEAADKSTPEQQRHHENRGDDQRRAGSQVPPFSPEHRRELVDADRRGPSL